MGDVENNLCIGMKFNPQTDESESCSNFLSSLPGYIVLIAIKITTITSTFIRGKIHKFLKKFDSSFRL